MISKPKGITTNNKVRINLNILNRKKKNGLKAIKSPLQAKNFLHFGKQ